MLQYLAKVLKQKFKWSLVEGQSPCSSLSTDPSARNIWFDAVLLKYLIGYSYLEHFDMMVKSFEGHRLAVEVNIGNCDWMLRYLKGLCGGFCLMLDQSSGKITALFIKAHLTEQGHLCPSQEYKQSACPAATMKFTLSQDQIWIHFYLFLPSAHCHMKQSCHKSNLKSFISVYEIIHKFIDTMYIH